MSRTSVALQRLRNRVHPYDIFGFLSLIHGVILVYHHISHNIEFRSQFDTELDDVEEVCRAGIVKVSDSLVIVVCLSSYPKVSRPHRFCRYICATLELELYEYIWKVFYELYYRL